MAANITGMVSLLASMKVPDGVNPVVVKLPSPPVLEGALAPNDWLTKAQAYALNAINGPESLVVVNRYIYTGLKDGWVVEIQPSGRVRKILRMSIRSCGQPDATEDACGRPLGVRADQQGYLLVADAYNGIFRIHPTTGQFRQLVDGRNQMVNGKPLRYINDLAVAKDGTIFFTSSSIKWKPSQLLNIMFEGETSGRVLVYNPGEILAARRVQELITNLHYPNGIQLSPDESFLLIGEGGRSKIHRAYISRKSPKFGTIDTFAENLPGFVDNIRLSPRGTYWVGLSRARHSTLPSVLDTYGDQPSVRGNLIALVSNNMVFDEPNFGIVVELNADGKIIRSLQDPDGSKFTSVSEVAEEKGLLFIASKNKDFIGVIDMNTIPKPIDPPPGTSSVDLSNITEVDLKNLLSGVQERMQKLNEVQVRGIVLMLVQELYKAKLEAKKARDEVSKLRADVQRLQELMAQGGGPPSSTPFPFGGGGAGGNGQATSWPIGGAITNPPPITTTTSPTTTTEGAVVVPPDMSGSSGLGGSVDGGSGGVGGPVGGVGGPVGVGGGSAGTGGTPGGVFVTTQTYPVNTFGGTPPNWFGTTQSSGFFTQTPLPVTSPAGVPSTSSSSGTTTQAPTSTT